MQPSPLSLESHFFRKIHLNVEDSPNPGDPNSLECSVSFGRDRDDPLRFRVVLGLKMDADKGMKPPYRGEFEIAGTFRVHEKWPAEKTESLVTVSGPTLLYGAIREMLINLTSRMEHGPIQLRTLSFADPNSTSPSSKKKTARKRTSQTSKAK